MEVVRPVSLRWCTVALNRCSEDDPINDPCYIYFNEGGIEESSLAWAIYFNNKLACSDVVGNSDLSASFIV